MSKDSQTPPTCSKCKSPLSNGWFINAKKHWQLGNWDSGIVAEGKDAPIPYIGPNDNWWVDDVDTGKPSRGKAGIDGINGNGWISVIETTTAPPVGSSIGDIIINGADTSIDVGATTPVLPGAYVQILSESPFQVTTVIGRIQGAKGDDGEGEVGPPGSSIEERYAINGSISVPPTLDNTQRAPTGWTTGVPTAGPTQYVWKIKAYISHTNTLIGLWGSPQRETGAPGTNGENGTGPGVMIRGDWSATDQYSGSPIKIEAVKYLSQGWLTRYDAGNIPIGTLPSNTQYWNGPFANVDPIFTDTLVSYQAYIGNLTVGSLRTEFTGTRMEIIKAENRLKFYQGANADPSLEVGIIEVPRVGVAAAGGIEIGGVRYGSNAVSSTSRGFYYNSDQGNGFYRVLVPALGTYDDYVASNVNINTAVKIYARETGNISVFASVTNSLYIYKTGGAEADMGIFVGFDPVTLKPYKGATGVSGGMKFVDGIYVGPE